MDRTVVIDTNVLVGALIGDQGSNREVLRRCFLRQYNPLISNALFLEVEDVCSRDSVMDACPLAKDEIRGLLNAYYKVCSWIPIYYLWRPNLRDEGDNFLIELAIAGNASCIVTNNVRDLRSAELKFPEISIATPAQLLKGE